ncbi:MAG: helical backbone metal receptor [Lentisphaeria bacterium]
MRILFTIMWMAALLITGWGCDRSAAPQASNSRESAKPEKLRIISMAPSLTEMLFALGLGDRVIGVTKFRQSPPEALNKPVIGGFYDANYEKIVRLNPTLVVLLEAHDEAQKKFDVLGIKYLEVDNHSTEDILESLVAIGKRCDAEDAARQIVRSITQRINQVRRTAAEQDKSLRVLICIGRAMGSGQVKDAYLAGPGTIYDELLGIAGAENAYSGRIEYPTVGAEAIVRMDPDIIIDLATNLEEKGLTPEDVRAEWRALPGLRAVRNQRLYVLTEDYVTVPGPRFIKLLEDLNRILYAPPGNN